MDIEIDVEEDDDITEMPAKRHKKHKKKHKRKTKDEEDVVSPKTSIKLKLKIGAETMGTKNMVPMISDAKPNDGEGGGKDLSEEERWLEALEKGNLNSYGEIGSGRKDPSLLTARQKAMLHGSQSELMQLPSGYKTVELTDEQKQLRQEKARRRKQQANEKMENDKTQTVKKLLKKQDSKNKRAAKLRSVKKSNAPRIVYKNTVEGIGITFPLEAPCPMTATIAGPYPEVKLCEVDGCSNPKTSVCSKSNVAICSLACYKKNFLKLQQQPSTHSSIAAA